MVARVRYLRIGCPAASVPGNEHGLAKDQGQIWSPAEPSIKLLASAQIDHRHDVGEQPAEAVFRPGSPPVPEGAQDAAVDD